MTTIRIIFTIWMNWITVLSGDVEQTTPSGITVLLDELADLVELSLPSHAHSAAEPPKSPVRAVGTITQALYTKDRQQQTSASSTAPTPMAGGAESARRLGTPRPTSSNTAGGRGRRPSVEVFEPSADQQHPTPITRQLRHVDSNAPLQTLIANPIRCTDCGSSSSSSASPLMGPWPSSQAMRTQSGPVGPVIDAMSGSPRQLPHSSARHRVPVNPMGLLDTPPLKRSDNKMNPPPLNRPVLPQSESDSIEEDRYNRPPIPPTPTVLHDSIPSSHVPPALAFHYKESSLKPPIQPPHLSFNHNHGSYVGGCALTGEMTSEMPFGSTPSSNTGIKHSGDSARSGGSGGIERLSSQKLTHDSKSTPESGGKEAMTDKPERVGAVSPIEHVPDARNLPGVSQQQYTSHFNWTL